ncbi:transketolase [Roseospira marina]|uniref:Transketolase n=1 Tax=Roseospira marina TaxID=140057 RepID=A0A5M6IAM5_9PROT|nr:transketolase C-terminal domain-containing protein [Roseospira marina]KAA5605202.1 transketolase [Roseospira marina]MBB4314655.1 transketolase [Roseospira marina]MBB5087644.1 transketolase [Roseospira marina]
MMEITPRTARQWSRLGSRGIFGQAILSVAEDHPELMVLSADLGNSSGLDRFKAAYPDQFLNTGIAEQNMIGVAAGLAKEGFTVFATSFAPFIAMRASEQVRMNLGYMEMNVKAVAIGSGIAMGLLGNSHFGLEDVAVMRAIPNLTVVCPADCAAIIKTVEAAVAFDGPMYIRLTGAANNPPVYTEDFAFQIGRAIPLRDGGDVGLVACGTMVHVALRAADALAEQGIAASVIDMHTLKPLDGAALDALAARVPALVTVEEHTVIGGLGSAVAEHTAAQPDRVRHLALGLRDAFVKTGQYEYMLEQEGLVGPAVAERVRAFLREERT